MLLVLPDFKLSPDWIICLVTSQFTKLFYWERANITHIIQSGGTLPDSWRKVLPNLQCLLTLLSPVGYKKQARTPGQLLSLTSNLGFSVTSPIISRVESGEFVLQSLNYIKET